MSEDKARDTQELEEGLPTLLLIAAGPTIWTLHFLAVYCTGAVLCARSPDMAVPTLRWLVAGLTVLALAALVWLLWGAWRKWNFAEHRDFVHGESTEENRREFLGHAAFLLIAMSIIGVIFMALPPVFIASCA